MANIDERAKYYLVDDNGEGGLVSELDRVAMVDKPTLIIGLGGTGIEALVNSKYVLRRKLKYPVGAKYPGRLAFLGIDTDANVVEETRVGDVKIEDAEFQKIDEPNLDRYMADHATIPQPYLRDWLSNGVPAKLRLYGACGVRQFGRFMFMLKASDIIDRISEAVGAIYAAGKENGSGFGPNDEMNVFILTGISGGTGSGAFLDMAYLTRYVIETLLNRKVRMNGMIFMPDVNLCNVTTKAVRDYIPVNGYAALKELDFWMNAERGREFVQQYTPTNTVRSNAVPFDLCFLISPNGTQKEDYRNCMQTTGETLLNILTAPAAAPAGAPAGAAVGGAPGAGGTQGFDSFVSNLTSMLPHITTTYSGNYIYASMGMAERRLQLDQMATYIAYYLLTRVQKLFDQEPSKEEVKSFFSKKLKLDEHGMQQIFNQNLNVPPYGAVRDFDGFKEAIRKYNHSQVLDSTLLEEELELWANQSASFYNRNSDQVIDNRIAALRREIEALFVDQQVGPYYAHRMLHNVAPGSEDVLKLLKTAIHRQTTFLEDCEGLYTAKLHQAAAAKESARRNRLVPLVGPAKYNDYVEAVFEAYDQLRTNKLAAVLLKAYQEIHTAAVEYNNFTVETFSSILQALTEVFKANSNILTQVKVVGNTHNWNVCNFAQIKPMIDKAIQEIESSGNAKDLVHEFLDHMLTDRKDWIGEEGDLGGSFSRFVSVKFNSIMNMTLEDHYKTMMNLPSNQALVQHIETVVMPKMHTDAREMYTPNAVLSPISNAARRTYVSYPAIAPNIATGVKNYLTGKKISSDTDASQRNGSIFWFEAVFGVPLYAHNSMVNYQKLYDAYGAQDNHLGRHLYMGDGNNWLNLLPSVLPDSMWSVEQYANEAQAAKNGDIRADFDKGWEAGLFADMPGAAGKYVLATVDKAAYDAMMAKAVLTDEEKQLIAEGRTADVHADKKAVKKFVDEADAFLAGEWKPSADQFMSEAFTMLGGGEYVDPNPGTVRTRQILRENLLHTPDMAAKLKAQTALKQKMTDLVKLHKDFLGQADTESKMVHTFAQALFYGLYKRVVPKVYQLDVTGTTLKTFPLMNVTDYAVAPQDSYYAMFRKMCTLPAEQMGVIEKLIDNREKLVVAETGRGEIERYAKYIEFITEVDKKMRERLDTINMDVNFEREEIREFYMAMLNEFAAWLAE